MQILRLQKSIFEHNRNVLEVPFFPAGRFRSLNREILRLAVPNILSNISVPLLSTVDTALMGRVSELHIGAVGLGAMIFNFIYWNFGFLRMGTTGLTAQAFGRQDREAIASVLARALILAIVLAIALIALQYPLGVWSARLLGAAGEQDALVREYFFIRIWAAPASLGLYAFMGWFFGMQNPYLPLAMTVVGNLVNIAMSYFLVRHMGWGVAGVAWGTVIAQYFGLVLAMVFLWWRYRGYLPYLRRDVLLQWAAFRRFLRLNSDIFLRTLLLTLSFALFYSFSNREGAMILAVNVILLQFVNWMSYGVDGFAFASESLVGKYEGAQDRERTVQAIWLSFGWGMVLAVGYAMLYGFLGQSLLRVFTNQADVIATAGPYLVWMVLFPLLSTPSYIWDGVFIGLTASKAMRNSMISAFIVFLVVYFTLGRFWGNHGLWLTLILFMLARGTFQQVLFLRKGLGLK